MYYPKSQIQTDLYTNGDELLYLNPPQNTYVGYYWKTSQGKYFTGKTPQDLPTQELILRDKTPSYTPNQNPVLNSVFTPNDFPPSEYPKYQFSNAIIPQYDPMYPTLQDYQAGEFRRYFCKKINEIIYIEINAETYNKLKNQDDSVLWQLYFPFYISWKLNSDFGLDDVKNTNVNMITLTSINLNLPKFIDYFKFNFTTFAGSA